MARQRVITAVKFLTVYKLGVLMSKMPHVVCAEATMSSKCSVIPLRDIGLASLGNKHLGHLDFAVVHSSDL